LSQGESPENEARRKAIGEAYGKVGPMNSQAVEMVSNSDYDGAKYFVMDKLAPAQAALGAEITAAFKRKAEEGVATAEAARKAYRFALTLMLVMTGVSITIGVAVAYIITRGITLPLSQSVAFAKRVASGELGGRMDASGKDEISTLLAALNDMSAGLARTVAAIRVEADKVSARAADLSTQTERAIGRAQLQSDRIIEVSSSMEEVSVAITEVSNGAAAVNTAAEQTRAISREGNDRMALNLEVVGKIVGAAEESGVVVAELSESIGKINEITKVIKEIAEQTNLLALNAAIEAARAGEQGRGFAVVADEVRKLAERTAVSTSDISAMTANISAKTGQAVSAMDRVRADVETGAEYTKSIGDALRQIVEAAANVSELSHHIANATREQSAASEQTTRNVEEISAISEETSATVKQAGAAAAEMAQAAAELRQLVDQFKIVAR
jgi:methyl-accepting chemotaxis protein